MISPVVCIDRDGQIYFMLISLLSSWYQNITVPIGNRQYHNHIHLTVPYDMLVDKNICESAVSALQPPQEVLILDHAT